jgi:hypothetical protein
MNRIWVRTKNWNLSRWWAVCGYGRTRGSVGLRREERGVRYEDTVECNMQNVAFRLWAKMVERDEKVT